MSFMKYEMDQSRGLFLASRGLVRVVNTLAQYIQHMVRLKTLLAECPTAPLGDIIKMGSFLVPCACLMCLSFCCQKWHTTKNGNALTKAKSVKSDLLDAIWETLTLFQSLLV